MQLLAGTDAGTGVRGHVRVWGEFCCSAPQYGRGHGGGETRGTHRNTHTHREERTRKCCTYPLATYPLKSARIVPNRFVCEIDWLFAQKPFESPNPPNPPQARLSQKTRRCPEIPQGIPTEFVLSAMQNSSEFPWIFLKFEEFAQIP